MTGATAEDRTALVERMFRATLDPSVVPDVMAGRVDLGRYWHPDVTIIVFEEAFVPEPFHGHEGLKAWIANALEIIPDGGFELLEFLHASPDDLAVKQRGYGTAKTTGLEASLEFSSHLKFRDDLIVYAHGYLRPEDAIAAAARGEAVTRPSG